MTEHVKITQDTLNFELNPLTFYNVLPSDFASNKNEISPSFKEWDQLISRIMKANLKNLRQQDLDDLTLTLSSPGSAPPPDKLKALADHLSLQYLKALSQKTMDRKKKMFIQRLNFFLRAILDQDINLPSGCKEMRLPFQCPWDFIQKGNKSLYIFSGEKNFAYSMGNETERVTTLGLPTQVDNLGENLFGVGSQYTNGGYLFSKEKTRYIPHDIPVILFFYYEQELCFLDSMGTIHFTQSKMSLTTGLENVSKARKHEQILYIMNWTQPFTIFTFDLNESKLNKISLKEIFIPNDVLLYKDSLFLIDKQQGYLFQYDLDFNLRKKELGFGRGPGRLFDPISLRPSENGEFLEILNWVPGTITQVPTDIFLNS